MLILKSHQHEIFIAPIRWNYNDLPPNLGVKARLRPGKANTGQDRYGYRRVGENIEFVEEEAKWVRQIFTWYIEVVRLMEIHSRLIEAGAPQKACSVPHQINWSRVTINYVLKAAKDYSYGIKIQRRCGEGFEIPIPPILNPAIYQRYLQVREANKKYPAHHMRNDYLLGSLLVCNCNRRWGARASSYTRKNRYGEKVERKVFHWRYYCPELHKERKCPKFGKSIGAKKADGIVWTKVCNALSDPEVLLCNVRIHIHEL